MSSSPVLLRQCLREIWPPACRPRTRFGARRRLCTFPPAASTRLPSRGLCCEVLQMPSKRKTRNSAAAEASSRKLAAKAAVAVAMPAARLAKRALTSSPTLLAPDLRMPCENRTDERAAPTSGAMIQTSASMEP